MPLCAPSLELLAGCPGVGDVRTVVEEAVEKPAERIVGLVAAAAQLLGGCVTASDDEIALLVAERIAHLAAGAVESSGGVSAMCEVGMAAAAAAGSAAGSVAEGAAEGLAEGVVEQVADVGEAGGEECLALGTHGRPQQETLRAFDDRPVSA